jgi:hypothetical protein
MPDQMAHTFVRGEVEFYKISCLLHIWPTLSAATYTVVFHLLAIVLNRYQLLVPLSYVVVAVACVVSW